MSVRDIATTAAPTMRARFIRISSVERRKHTSKWNASEPAGGLRSRSEIVDRMLASLNATDDESRVQSCTTGVATDQASLQVVGRLSGGSRVDRSHRGSDHGNISP